MITGGTGGIGYHLSEGFHQSGFQVTAADFMQHRELSSGIDFIQTDLRSESEITALFSNTVKAHGSIHVLINNAAISNFSKPISEINMTEFDEVINVNLRGSFICCREFLRANKGQDYGRIINIASTRWHQNEPDWEVYGASKGGITSLTRSLVVSLADTPITVNTISPGWIQTSDYEGLSPEEHAQHPSGRVGTPRDFINGANLVIDGGMTKRMIYTA